MVTSSRPEDSAVDLERWPVAESLVQEPYRFDFFQAVRLLARMFPGRQVVGRFSNPRDEVVRLGVNPGMAFPASQVQEIETSLDGPVKMRVNFMGLIGPLGVLPVPYSEMVLERMRARDNTTRDFFDIFHHRMISLFFQAWEKYRFTMAYERGERDLFSRHLLATIGLDTPGLENRQNVSDDSLLFYSGLLSLEARSALGLRQILLDYFGVPVEIDQFVGAWYALEPEAQCALDESGRDSESLGFGCVVGDEVWDQQSRVRIRLGPLELADYQGFLPGGDAHRALRALTAFYAGSEFDLELQLILRRDAVPPCELAGAEPEAPLLGWTSWMKSAPFHRDPGETILEI
jgi:type VI secretion system protein ImpH